MSPPTPGHRDTEEEFESGGGPLRLTMALASATPKAALASTPADSGKTGRASADSSTLRCLSESTAAWAPTPADSGKAASSATPADSGKAASATPADKAGAANSSTAAWASTPADSGKAASSATATPADSGKAALKASNKVDDHDEYQDRQAFSGMRGLCALSLLLWGFPRPLQNFVWDPVLVGQGLGHRVILIIMAIGFSLVQGRALGFGFSCSVSL